MNKSHLTLTYFELVKSWGFRKTLSGVLARALYKVQNTSIFLQRVYAALCSTEART
jgi:hypothetical protein